MAATTAGWEKRRPKTVETYIKSKTKKVGNCLIWKGARKGRVGSFSYKNKNGGAPRMVYKLTVRDLPEEICVLHTCDDSRCVRKKHLYEGDRKQNRKDFMERHPRARQLLLKASKIGAKGVKRFWDGMSKKKRKEFCRKRMIIQAAKRAAT